MGPDVARRIWEIFSEGMPNVRTEISSGTAIEHSLAYFARCQKGDSLLFCLGDADQAHGDPRFSELAALSARHGVKASVVAAGTGGMPVRSTHLRDALIAGPAGCANFLAALPPHLGAAARRTVWQVCQDGLRDVSDIAIDRARALVPHWGLGDVRKISCVRTGKLDPVIRIELARGRVVFLKDAGDTVEAGRVGNPWFPKPAARIGVERRAIRRLSPVDGVELPEIVYFDKESRTLALGEVCSAGTWLRTELERGVFEAASAEATGIALAALHSRSISSLWGDLADDVAHWRRMLALKTQGFPAAIQPALDRLACESEQARETGFVHLDFVPKNIRIGSTSAGVIDLELSASTGDRAYDLGCLLAHYILHGHAPGVVSKAFRAFGILLGVYRRTVGEARYLALEPRMIAFAGAEVLYQCKVESPWGNQPSLRAIAGTMLTSGLSTAASAGFLDALPCVLALGEAKRE